MTHSDSIRELAAALSKAQGQMAGAKKDSDNPFYKTKYADLASVWEAIRKPLADHGLSVVQMPETAESGVRIVTLILHASGEWVRSECVFPVTKPDAQGYGSATTYGKRYMLQGLGVAPEDDDGEASVGRGDFAGDEMPRCEAPGCSARARWEHEGRNYCGVHTPGKPPPAKRQSNSGKHAAAKALEAELATKRLLMKLHEIGWRAGDPYTEKGARGETVRRKIYGELLGMPEPWEPNVESMTAEQWVEVADKLSAILADQVAP